MESATVGTASKAARKTDKTGLCTSIPLDGMAESDTMTAHIVSTLAGARVSLSELVTGGARLSDCGRSRPRSSSTSPGTTLPARARVAEGESRMSAQQRRTRSRGGCAMAQQGRRTLTSGIGVAVVGILREWRKECEGCDLSNYGVVSTAWADSPGRNKLKCEICLNPLE